MARGRTSSGHFEVLVKQLPEAGAGCFLRGCPIFVRGNNGFKLLVAHHEEPAPWRPDWEPRELDELDKLWAQQAVHLADEYRSRR